MNQCTIGLEHEPLKEVRNFFEQDSSSQDLRAEPVPNDILWVGTQRQIGNSLNFNSKAYIESLGSEQRDHLQPSQIFSGTNLTHLRLEPELFRSQARNQQSMMNGFMHGSQGLQTRPNQAEFLGNGTVTDRQNLMLRGLAAVEAPQGNAFEYNSGLTRSAERSDIAEAPVGFDFLGGQQQLMRSQHPGISQPRPRQQPGYNDMHLLQQQLMYRQIQEIQRQQQLQQLAQGGMQQNQFSQLSGTEKQVSGVQLPAMLSGMPIHNASNRMWSNELMGGDPKTPSSSQILVAGNMNWMQRSGSPSMHGLPNGLMLSHDHGQAMRSMGTVPQQIDQSLYGTPIINARGSLNYSQFPGMSFEPTATKTGGNLAEKVEALNFQNEDFQGKTLFGNSPMQNLNGGVPSGSFQQVNLLSHSVQAHEFQDRQEQPNWSSSTQKSEQQEGLSHGVTNLDATEEKLLFSTDDDGNWNGNTSTGGYLHRTTPLEGNDYFGGFPSIQSGSWSALMQEALGASSSDTGVQEEWRGLNVEKTALPTGNHSAGFDDNGKQQMTWDDSNTQNASSLASRTFPLFNDGDKGSNCLSGPSFQQSTKFTCQQDDRVQHESFQQPATEANKKQLDHSDQQKQFGGSSLPAQMHFANLSNGAWTGQMHHQSVKSAADTEFNLQNMQGIWAQQQKVPLQNISSHPSSKPNSWNMNETLSPSGPNSLKVFENDDKIRNAQRNDIKKTTHLERDFNPAVKNSNTQRLNQHIVSRHQDDLGKQVAVDSSVSRKGDHEPSGVAQPFDSLLNIREKGSCEMYDNKEENSHPKKVLNEGYTHNYSNASQHTDSGSGASKNSILAGNGPRTSIGGTQKLSGQSGRKTLVPRKFQHHPMGNVEINMESANSKSHTPPSQGSSQLFVHGLKTQEQAYVGCSQFVVSHAVANNAADMGKRLSTELQKDAGGTVGQQAVGIIRSQDPGISTSFDGSTSRYDQNRRVGQASQNMLELLHKVDQSRDSNTHSQFGYSDRNAHSLGPEVDPSDEAGSHLQLNQSSALQGVGLGLAPPAQAQAGPNHALHMQSSLQTVDESGSRHADSEAARKDQTFSLPLSHEVSQREDLNNITDMSGQMHRVASQPNIQGNYSLAASTLSHARNQQHQQQQAARATGVAMMSQASNLSFGNRVNANEHVKQVSYVRQTHEGVVDQSAQASSSGVSGRVFPSRLASAGTDSRAPLGSQFYSLNTGLSRPVNSIASHLRSTGQQLPVVESRSAQSSSLSGTAQQQGGFSTMLQNVWTNISAQRHLSGVHPQKVIPNMLHPMSQLSSSRTTGPWLPQKRDDQSNRERVSSPSELDTCPAKSGQATDGEEARVEDNSLQQLDPEGVDVTASQGQKLLPKQVSDGNSVVSIPSLARLHQQELSKGRLAQDSSLDLLKEHVSLPNVASSNHDTGAFGSNPKQSDVQMQNYSLLQQMQAMKGADSDLSKRAGKRLRGADSGNDASQTDWKTSQRYIYAQNTMFGIPGDGQLGATSQQSSFPSGVKMLSFSSRENEEKSSNTSSELTGSVIPQSLLASAQHDLQNHINSLGTTSTSTSTGGNEQPQISPHMAPTWFKQYGTYKNGQIVAMYDGFGNSQPIAKAAAQNYFSGKASENRVSNIAAEQRDDASQVGGIWQSTPSIIAAVQSSPHCLPLDVMDNNTVLRPKKRKSPTSELLPWHKEVAYRSRKLANISMAELEWTQATNRLAEKVEDEVEITEDGPALPRSRRRLVLTTQLMQQLLPSVPTRILRANASTSYESVTYFVAKFALGNACSLICRSGSDSHVHNDSENMASERIKTPEMAEDHIFSKIVEDFVGRARKLENDLLRLDKRVSILDLRMECQDLERCSIINRFAKFHGRAQTDGVESSSTSESVPRRACPQRQAIAVPMPRNIPEGVLCLSL